MVKYALKNPYAVIVMALAILVGAMSLGICIIIAAAIH